MIRIAFVSQTLAPMGGGAKDIALTFLHLDRRIFDPYILSLSDATAWKEEYGVSRGMAVDLGDVDHLSRALDGIDVVYLMVGTANEPSEYRKVWEACAKVKVKLKVMRIVFGLGEPNPEMADLFLTSSMDSHLVGTPCRGCHVIYPPLPPHSYESHPRYDPALRLKHGIDENTWVVGYACSDHRPEFFEVAHRFHEAHNPAVFLSALARPENIDVPPNVRFCGVLPQRDMPSLYTTCDILLHTRTESFGYSAHQAMAAGLPVVALWTGSRNAFAETMYPNGGYLARNLSGLMAALYAAHNQPVDADYRGRIARERTRDLCPENSVRRFEVLVLTALHEKGYFLDSAASVPNHYVTENDVRNWRDRKAEIERRLATELYI